MFYPLNVSKSDLKSVIDKLASYGSMRLYKPDIMYVIIFISELTLPCSACNVTIALKNNYNQLYKLAQSWAKEKSCVKECAVKR